MSGFVAEHHSAVSENIPVEIFHPITQTSAVATVGSVLDVLVVNDITASRLPRCAFTGAVTYVIGSGHGY